MRQKNPPSVVFKLNATVKCKALPPGVIFKLLLNPLADWTECKHPCSINTLLKIDAHYLQSERCTKATFSEIMLANLTGFVQMLSFGELFEHLKFAVSPKTPRMAIKYSEICMKKSVHQFHSQPMWHIQLLSSARSAIHAPPWECSFQC